MYKSSDATFSAEIFENDELNEDFQQFDLAATANEKAADAPPSKRRKVSPDSSILEEMITLLYSTLASQSVNDLAGLHQIAE